MRVKYYICGATTTQLNSSKIKRICSQIDGFMSAGDDNTLKLIKDLCAAIVNVNDITRDKLKSNSLAQEVKSKALSFRKANPPNSAGVPDSTQAIAATVPPPR